MDSLKSSATMWESVMQADSGSFQQRADDHLEPEI